jgi:amino acid transporter
MSDNKKIKWYMLCFMAFSTLWGFGNVSNGFMYFNGPQVIFSWILMFALYFVPYALMVGELGSAFKSEGGGVTSWVKGTNISKVAYFAGWTYWAVHVSYIASKGSGGLKAISWMIFGNAETYDSLPTLAIQLATLAVFLFFCWFASRGLNPLKKLATLAGSSMFVMSLLFILMMFAAPAINPNGGYVSADFSLENLIPNIDITYITNLSILVFAVGGIEKISPYVNKVDGNPARQFPKAIIVTVIMVLVCALLGTIAMSMMFDVNDVNANFSSYVANGAYWAFQKLGNYYGVGNLLLIIYAACNAIGQFSTLVVSIDAPLRMLLGDENSRQYVPKALLKQNDKGAYINGIKMVVVLSGAIILAQIVVPGAAAVLTQLNKLNSVCMPLRYLWVFVAYFGLKKAGEKFNPEYKFVKGNKLGMVLAAWCFFVTLFCCITGMYSTDTFTMVLNVVTPCVLTALGLILPQIRKYQDAKELAAGSDSGSAE